MSDSDRYEEIITDLLSLAGEAGMYAQYPNWSTPFGVSDAWPDLAERLFTAICRSCDAADTFTMEQLEEFAKLGDVAAMGRVGGIDSRKLTTPVAVDGSA